MLYLKNISDSIVNFDFYKQVFEQKLKETGKYLIFILFVFSIFSTIITGPKLIDTLVSLVKEQFNGRIPEIIIEKGVLRSDIEQPAIKKIDKFYLIIDTTDQIKDLNESYPAGLLLNSNKIVLKNNFKRKQSFDISKIKYFIINETQIHRWKKAVFWIFLPFFVMLFLALNLSSNIFLLFFASALGIVILKFMKIQEFKFQNTFNIAVYALTPTLIIKVFTILFHTNNMVFILFPYVIFFIYFILAVKTIAESVISEQ